jgi:hypothetical protein
VLLLSTVTILFSNTRGELKENTFTENTTDFAKCQPQTLTAPQDAATSARTSPILSVFVASENCLLHSIVGLQLQPLCKGLDLRADTATLLIIIIPVCTAGQQS